MNSDLPHPDLPPPEYHHHHRGLLPTRKPTKRIITRFMRSKRPRSMRHPQANPMLFEGIYNTMKEFFPHLTKNAFSRVFEAVKKTSDFSAVLNLIPNIPNNAKSEINAALQIVVKNLFDNNNKNNKKVILPIKPTNSKTKRGGSNPEYLLDQSIINQREAAENVNQENNEIAFGAAMVHIFIIACWSGGLRNSNIISLLLSIILFYFYIMIDQWDDRRANHTSIAVPSASNSVFAMLLASVYNCVMSMFSQRPTPLRISRPPAHPLHPVPISSPRSLRTIPDFFPPRRPPQ